MQSNTRGNGYQVIDSSGGVVSDRGYSAHVDCFDPSASDCAWPWGPGETEAAGACWDQTDWRTHTRVPPGTYTAKIGWSGPVDATAWVTIQIAGGTAAPATTMVEPPGCETGAA